MKIDDLEEFSSIQGQGINIEALVKQLVSMRAQIDAALFLLHEQVPCKHNDKLSLTVMGGKEEWICKKCQFHYKEE